MSDVWAWMMRWDEKVRCEIGRLNLSHAELARRIGEPNPNNVRRWVKGMHEPPPKALKAIADTLGWPLAYLLDDRQPYPPPRDESWVEEILYETRPTKDVLELMSWLKDPEAREAMTMGLRIYLKTRAPTNSTDRTR